MEKILHEISLDLKNENYVKVVVNQNEANSRELVARVMDDAREVVLSGSLVAMMRYTKADGKGVEADATITNGKIHVPFTEGMLSVPGEVPANITLMSEGQVISTMCFSLRIERAPLQERTVKSSDEYSALDKHHVELQEELKKTQELTKKAGEAATNASASASSASQSAETATNKASEASASAQSAQSSATNASASASSASQSAETATNKASEASASAQSAQGSATNASASASSASQSAETATNKASEASKSAQEAFNYAKGENDSAKYYYNQAKGISESIAGALRPIGTISFDELPPLSAASEGGMYNISDEFTTTADFKEGEGKIAPEGSNIYKTMDGKWDILAGTPVTGVKGAKETTYRRGNVNITPSNIGAVPTGGSVTQNYVEFESADHETEVDAELPAVLEKKETLGSLFGKVSQAVKNIRWIIKTIGEADISTIGDGTIKGAVNSLNLKMDGNATYSMDEVNTHKKWINGRDIYRKVYNIATIPANTATCIDSTMNASKIQSIVRLEGCATDKNNALVPIPYHNGQQNSYDNYWYITTSGLYITTMSIGGLSQATITIEYVKKS